MPLVNHPKNSTNSDDDEVVAFNVLMDTDLSMRLGLEELKIEDDSSSSSASANSDFDDSIL